MKWLRSILCTTLVCVTAQTYAGECYESCDESIVFPSCTRPFTFGFNYKQSWIKPVGEWKNFFVTTQPGFNVYFGWRFNRFFGMDAGYEWTANKPKSFIIPRGSSMLGVVNNTPKPITATSKIRYKTGHIDLNMFFPTPPIPCLIEPEAILTLGVAGMKPSLKIFMAPNNSSTYNYVLNYIPIIGRSMAVYRFGVGAQAILIEDFGVRLMLRYETTSVLRARNSFIVHAPATRKLFENGYSAAAGFFFRF